MPLEAKKPRLDEDVFDGDLASIIESPESKDVNGVAVPLVIQCNVQDATVSSTEKWIQDNQKKLEKKLSIHGAILFRGFPLSEVAHFDTFVSAFSGWNDLSYEDSLSFAVRIQKSGRICTTNEGRTGGLVFHHEQAQSPRFPSKLFFCCEKAAAEGDGGQTGVCRSDQVLDELRQKYPEFIEKCERVGVKYTIYMSDTNDTSKGVGRSWKSYFSASSKEDCERRMTELGYTWLWQDDGILKATTPRLDVVAEAPGTSTKCFFNQLPATTNNAVEFSKVGEDGSGLGDDVAGGGTTGALAPTQEGLDKCIAFADGSSMRLDILLDAKDICEKHAVNLNWRDGDVALLDNYLVMHARRIWNAPVAPKYMGPLGSRKLLASLVQ